MMDTFIFILFLFFEITDAKRYVCSDTLQTIKVNNTDELIFFESLDFPKLFTSDDCLLNFVLENATRNMRGILIRSIALSDLDDQLKFDIIVFENVTSILFVNKNEYYFESFRGYVLFDDWGDDCPLESISRVNPFKFTDETQEIYFQSSYYPNTYNTSTLQRKHPCLWQFSAPTGYGFKFVIESLNQMSSTHLNIENSTEVLLTERNIRVKHAYYNKDNYLKFYLYDKTDVVKPLSLDNFEFAVSVSIYKNDQKIVDGGCKIITNGSVDTWTNFNDNGYPNNAQCTYDLIIPSGYVVYADVVGNFLETFDTIFYYDQSTNESDFISISNEHKFFYGNENGDDKSVNWIFTSDASINSLGFSIDFYKYVCECSNSTIFIHYITKPICVASFASENYCHQIYCANLTCNYTLVFDKIYQNKNFYLNFLIRSIDLPDIFKLYTNNENVFTSNKTTRLEDNLNFLPPIFFSSENENIFELTTFEYSMSYYVSITIKSQEALPFTYNIALSDSMPYKVIDINDEYNGILVKYNTSKLFANASIQVYNDVADFWIYKDETFTDYIKYCLRIDANCEINLNKFTILAQYQTFFVIHLSNVIPIGCIFKEYIFYPLGDTTITAISNLGGSCKILIVFDSSTYLIQRLWTNSKNKNVTVYFGANEEKYFFEFNRESASQWENLLLATRVYTFEIPPNSSMFISLVFQPHFVFGDYFNQYYNIIEISKYPFQSLLATYDYGINRNYEEMSSGLNVTYILADHLDNYSLEFQVIHYNMSNSFECYFVKDNQKQDVTHLNQKFNVTKDSIQLIYTFDDPFMPMPHSADQGILFSVNLIRPESTARTNQ